MSSKRRRSRTNFTAHNHGLDTRSPAYLPLLLQSGPYIKFRRDALIIGRRFSAGY